MCLAHEPCAHHMEGHAMRLGHYPCEHGFASLSCVGHVEHVPRASGNAGHRRIFLLLFWVKPALLAQTQAETLTINTSLPCNALLLLKR